MKQYLKWAAKLLATGALLYWVFLQTDRESLFKALKGSNKVALLLSFVPYLVSRVSGAMRLTAILNAIGVPLSQASGMRLNWVSMFYGMFLPGGLGGDAYKLIHLKRLSPDKGTLLLTRALLWDRLIGLVLLVMITALFSMPYLSLNLRILTFAVVLAGCIVFWLAGKRWFPEIIPRLGKLLALSSVVQSAQIFCICILLYSIQVYTDFGKYNLLFLISSAASTLPISVGGIGVREVVFLKGAELLVIPTQAAVTVSVLFDIIVTLAAATGCIPIIIKSRSGSSLKPN
ncbi:lysylphosphatidylglycerol synthase transmembrane domain-containing protein [Dyadobacter arcticus]|uniref:Flippase-like domain-containing protein n=1 Tax=Dyadobacter arcticus TaxID=1078754 RepID=A0ABX0USB4_9BACT|nr:lysylphosphatidylglycerol synthase transmembrane domain-containing protein [Dyadobacter arcticus]NIJ54535.1 hypothetical protein [Dyadobacter arcticus]